MGRISVRIKNFIFKATHESGDFEERFFKNVELFGKDIGVPKNHKHCLIGLGTICVEPLPFHRRRRA
jgi:hypothetical protein